jgi:adenylate cyclase
MSEPVLASSADASSPPFESFIADPTLPSTTEIYRRALAKYPDRLAQANELRDWLFAEARTKQDTHLMLAGLCERLNRAGVPIDRGAIALRTLHSEHAAVGRLWIKGEGSSGEKFAFGERVVSGGWGADPQVSAAYLRSPFYRVHEARRPLSLWLQRAPENLYGVVPDLKRDGYAHYLCYPIFFGNGDKNGLAFATTRREGFTEADLAVIGFMMPACAAVLEILGGYRNLDQLLRIYVGDEPHQAILRGAVRRGEVMRIRSAILFADMRNYTRLTSPLSPEAAVELLNAYFDCLVPPIETEGGEILKYMGDGLLAIFRERGDDLGGASQSALTAADKALARVGAAAQEGRFPVPVSVGIALHHGEAAYGNVGSGERLDFTVIGRDINLASRIAKLNKALREPLLMSQPFVEHLWADPEPLGLHVLDGFEEAVPIFRPSRR